MSTSTVTLASNTAWSIAKFRVGLIRALQETGLRVVALAGPDTVAASLPCEFLPIRVDRRGTNPMEDIRLLRELHRLYRSLRPAGALHFTSKPNIYGAIAAHLLGVPSVGNITGLGSAFLSGGAVGWIQQRLYGYALHRVDRVFFQNPDDHELFVRKGLVDSARSAVIPGSGVDLEEFAPRPRADNDLFVFLLIARLLRDKGIVEYVDAARRLRAAGAQATCRIVGFLDEGNPSGISHAELSEWVRSGLVEYRDARDDVREEIAASDCVVLPSYREGTSRTLLEAAAMARPLITSDAPGCRQVVDDRVTGYLCRPRDPMDLAEKMMRMMSLSAAERGDMGLRGRVKVEREYDERIVTRAYLDALQKLGIVPI